MRGTLMFEDSNKHDILGIALEPTEYERFCGVRMLFCYLIFHFPLRDDEVEQFLNQPLDTFCCRVVSTLMFRCPDVGSDFSFLSVQRLV